MTGPIVAPPSAGVEDVDPPRRRLTLVPDVHPLPPEPTLPSGAALQRAVEVAAAVAGHADPEPGAGVPAGVEAGPTDAADVLDWLTPEIAEIARKLADNAAGGFLVTAADRQRHGEVSRLIGEIGRILAERG